MADGPLGRAWQALQDAKQAQALKDTPAHRLDVEAARVHLDYLLDVLPIPHAPAGPVAHRPGPAVSYAVNSTGQAERVVLGDGECATTQQDTDSEED